MGKSTATPKKCVPRCDTGPSWITEAANDGKLAIEKRGEYRNPNLLRVVHEIPCVYSGLCGVEAAHSNLSRHGKCRGMKSSDAAIMALSKSAHDLLDKSGKIPKAEQAEWQCEMICRTYATLQAMSLIEGADFSVQTGWIELADSLIAQMEQGKIKIL
jgi:hypothetical protein